MPFRVRGAARNGVLHATRAAGLAQHFAYVESIAVEAERALERAALDRLAGTVRES